MGLQLLTTVWGESHIEMFKKTTLKSLSWPRNAKTLKDLDATWNIVTDDKFAHDLAFSGIQQIPGIKFCIRKSSMHRDYIDLNQSTTLWQMNECMKSGDSLILAPPDIIFGDGTIDGLWASGKDKDSVVVSPHARSTPEIIDLIQDKPYSNAELVTLSFKHLHECWTRAEKGYPNQCTYMGGVEWERCNDLIIGRHLLPTPYLIKFTEEDMAYFKSMISFGNFDWRWPGDILVGRGRQRYAASSDIAYCVEITDPSKNVPPIYENQPHRDQMLFHRNDPHNFHNKQIIFTLRGA